MGLRGLINCTRALAGGCRRRWVGGTIVQRKYIVRSQVYGWEETERDKEMEGELVAFASLFFAARNAAVYAGRGEIMKIHKYICIHIYIYLELLVPS